MGWEAAPSQRQALAGLTLCALDAVVNGVLEFCFLFRKSYLRVGAQPLPALLFVKFLFFCFSTLLLNVSPFLCITL